MSGISVIGDWGTSRLRLFRIENGVITDRRDGQGIGAVGRAAEGAFVETVAPWLADGLPESIILCGMVGARDGWVEAPYARCPADVDAWRQAAVRFDWRGIPIAIMGGLACESADGIPDVMRGEETQIFGAMARDLELATGRHLIVLPGTHNKWSLVENGRIVAFRTVPTGELFALLRDRSTLGPKVDVTDPVEEAAGFAEGMERAGDAKLLQSLFATRAMRLRSGRSADWATGYLSGLLIGCEIAEVRSTFTGADGVVLIGDRTLSARYAQALETQGIASRAMDGEDCALVGLGFLGGMTA